MQERSPAHATPCDRPQDPQMAGPVHRAPGGHLVAQRTLHDGCAHRHDSRRPFGEGRSRNDRCRASSLADPVTVAAANGAQSIRLGWIDGQPIYIASGQSGEIALDARSGGRIPPPDEAAIRKLATSYYTGRERDRLGRADHRHSWRDPRPQAAAMARRVRSLEQADLLPLARDRRVADKAARAVAHLRLRVDAAHHGL